jgi:hypothetical protein
MAALADDPNKTWTIDELKTKGEKVYNTNCVVCHQANGKGVPARSRRWTARKWSTVPRRNRSTFCCTVRRAENIRRNASLEATVGYGYRGCDHLHPQ